MTKGFERAESESCRDDRDKPHHASCMMHEKAILRELF